MKLVHRAKTTQAHIELDEARSVTPEAFATYTVREGDGPAVPSAVGWTLYVHPNVTNRYAGTSFELRLTPESIAALRRCLDVATERFI